MKGNYNYELIKDYLNGILDSKTSEKIRTVLTEDETARTIANGILILEDRFRTEEDVNTYLDAQLVKNIHLINDSESKKKSFGLLKIAASIALITVSTLVIYQYRGTSASEIVNNELSTPYQSAVAMRNAETVTPFEKGILLYNEMKYSEALTLLKSEESAQAGFFRGLCLLYTEEYQAAIKELSKEDLTNSRYQEQSRWYLTLSYLKSGQQEEANDLLNIIIERESHFRLEEAKRLSTSLND